MSGQNEFAIIGLGNIGKVISTNLAKSGRSFIVADRDQAKAKDLAQKLGIHVRPLDLDSAIRNADMLLLSIPFGSFRSFLAEYASLLSEKIILDPSNPIAPDGKGGFAKIIGQVIIFFTFHINKTYYKLIRAYNINFLRIVQGQFHITHTKR